VRTGSHTPEQVSLPLHFYITLTFCDSLCCVAALFNAVAALFNACAQVGSLPPAWALCAITPIPKSGAKTEPDNYRGIAVGTVLAKMYATLLNFRLTRWAEANNLRVAGQAGFREDYRCTDNLLILGKRMTLCPVTSVDQAGASGCPRVLPGRHQGTLC